MPKFFQAEQAAWGGEKSGFTNVRFKRNNFENSNAAESGTILEIIPVHIKNPPVIQFVAYIDNNITDSFKVGYSTEQPFGRTDPYHIWKSNSRGIRVNWAVPSSSVTSGLNNLNNLSWFLASLYPSFKDTTTATSVSASPLFRVRYANLICSATNDSQGALCIIKSVTVTHSTKEGFIAVDLSDKSDLFFGGRGDPRAALGASAVGISLLRSGGFGTLLSDSKKLLIPKEIKIGCNLDIVHDHALGWDHNTGQWRGGSEAGRFPYDFPLVKDVSISVPSSGGGGGGGETLAESAPTAGNTPAPNSIEAKQTQVVLDDISGAGLESGPLPAGGF